ncbi:putative DNA helicase ino80 [Rhizophlyctis rosea]|nr:putative DNA helicase ino80 [Rhizophlyctis rosea]
MSRLPWESGYQSAGINLQRPDLPRPSSGPTSRPALSIAELVNPYSGHSPPSERRVAVRVDEDTASESRTRFERDTVALPQKSAENDVARIGKRGRSVDDDEVLVRCNPNSLSDHHLTETTSRYIILNFNELCLRRPQFLVLAVQRRGPPIVRNGGHGEERVDEEADDGGAEEEGGEGEDVKSIYGDEDNGSSSDPDDPSGHVGPENHPPHVQKRLLKYMCRIRQNERRILSEEQRKQKRRAMKLLKKWNRRWTNDVQAQTNESDIAVWHPTEEPDLEEFEEHAEGEEASTAYTPPVEEVEKGEVLTDLQTFENIRHNIWIDIAKTEVPKAYKIMYQSVTIRQANLRKISALVQKEARKARQPTRQGKDLALRAKKAAKEMLMFWKRNEKEERDLRKKAEKEAMERRRVEEEMREAKRQARKLNFLITQTELYSHFIGKKIEDKARLETQPGSDASFNDIDFDAVDDAELEKRARDTAQQALAKQMQATRAFDDSARARRLEAEAEVTTGSAKGGDVTMSEVSVDESVDQMDFLNPSSMPAEAEIEQPKMLTCKLKAYQLKGLNWLANLYEQGINGILADEMGLGKTVQSISLMAYLAEHHDIWGPFLVISPASTLHNWQQEVARFTPQLKALPYWGNQQDRKVLRKFWNKKKLYSKDAPFHVLITSYQLIVSDEKHFQRIKWQYMILDEAQAIKSSTSARWKTLLGFDCRNRLLLTGTPIQNSMQELWALLHFIMPTLFDSHEEFSEWFSKDIESHAENKGTLNEHQLRRLHMILKPFMLRRIKKDVENELGDKVEVEVSCGLTHRQKRMYQGLKQKISLRELLDRVTSLGETEGMDSLMNLVIQFRKVCNHPELFERADVESPLMCFPIRGGVGGPGKGVGGVWEVPYNVKGAFTYTIPKRVYRLGMVEAMGEATAVTYDGALCGSVRGLFDLWHPEHVYRDLEGEKCMRIFSSRDDKATNSSSAVSHCFSFLRFVDTSPMECFDIAKSGLLRRWLLDLLRRNVMHKMEMYEEIGDLRCPSKRMFDIVRHGACLSGSSFEGLPSLCEIVGSEATVSILNRTPPVYIPGAMAAPIQYCCSDQSFWREQQQLPHEPGIRALLFADATLVPRRSTTEHVDALKWIMEVNEKGDGLLGEPGTKQRFTHISVPSANKLITDSGKMLVLEKLLTQLKAGGHRVLIYFQMTRMIDLMEEYLTYRQYTYLRLDGSTSISDRRDMVTDWQTRPEIFIFLLSTRAGGLGINLTAADTVIFYDSDWNPTVDQQAMDRAHRLGQTKQVTVYRLITAGTIEERILMRAKQKDQIQKVVISGGEFRQHVEFKPNEVLSLLLEDEELEDKLRQDEARRKAEEEAKEKEKAEKEKAKVKKVSPAKRKKGKEKVLAEDGGTDRSGERGSASPAAAGPKKARRFGEEKGKGRKRVGAALQDVDVVGQEVPSDIADVVAGEAIQARTEVLDDGKGQMEGDDHEDGEMMIDVV